MTDKLTARTTAITNLLLAIANALAALGLKGPTWTTAPAIAAINAVLLAAVSAIAAFKHYRESKINAAP